MDAIAPTVADQQMEFINAKPSQMIRMAVDDLERCEYSDKHEINMKVWAGTKTKSKFFFLRKEICVVCLGGSVLSQRFNVNHYQGRSWELAHQFGYDISKTIRDRMYALDSFREGKIETGLGMINMKKPENVPSVVQITNYEHDSSRFKQDMRALANTLEYHGL